MAYCDDLPPFKVFPAAAAATRARDIATSLGQIAISTFSNQSAPIATHLRAAQLPAVESCQSNIFTLLREIEQENAASRNHNTPTRARPWLFGLKHRISHLMRATPAQTRH